jgi:hypothetical protein
MLKPLQCDNTRCRTRFDVDDVAIEKEGDRLYFDCPVCDTRTTVLSSTENGRTRYWTPEH